MEATSSFKDLNKHYLAFILAMTAQLHRVLQYEKINITNVMV